MPNEKEVYSFTTEKGKKMVLARDKNNNYLVYRFGTDSIIELEFPEKNKSSWKKFNYSYYHRQGGASNEGQDQNYLYFINKDYKYILYDTHVQAGNGYAYFSGIKVINMKTKKVTDIPANSKTSKGGLLEFKNNNLVTKGDELFD